MLVLQSEYRLLSTESGIYLFLDKKGKILYVGKAKNLKKRVSSYFQKSSDLDAKTNILVSQIDKIKTITADSEIEAFLLESKLIKEFKPKYNVKLTDDKAYPMIKITIKDKIPKVLVVRRSDDKSVYFGPFPNGAQALRTVLKTIRKIFHYQSVPNHPNKICLYYHLGLCPCPPVFDSPEFRKEYKKDIRHIINFLRGNTKKVVNDLKKERDLLSSNEQFEKANTLQNKINAIELITGPFYKTKLDLDDNPIFTVGLRKKEITDLIDILNKNNYKLKKAERIECFDISNISGTYAAGSMVVFVNGRKDGNWYRKFKIRTLNTPNDFAMMQEVLQRRFRHKEWPFPDLLIVDGGKGQISIALKVLKSMNLNIPIVGLAKREETIVTSDFKEIVLPKNSDALKLIMRIRDEAHRFAITYHKLLRSKSLLS